MEKSEKIYEKKLRTILWHNFLAGITWGLGVTVGATIFLAIGLYYTIFSLIRVIWPRELLLV